MDIEGLDDSDFEPDADAERDLLAAGSESEDESGLGTESISATPFHEVKWRRLRPSFNDQYLEILKESGANHEDQPDASDFNPSQLGVVRWETDEKARFFAALSRSGRHDLPAIAAHVRTKSELEVKDYLDLLQQAFIDRQLFEDQTKNISHAQIPAAAEIGPECEQALEKAADALAAFQEQYDHAVGKQASSSAWQITHQVANQLDKAVDQSEELLLAQDDDSGDMGPTQGQDFRLFRLSTLLELSENLFMNGAADGRHDHWENLAAEGERPSITSDAVAELDDLTTNLLRRLIQSTLFLAKSRIRASAATDFRPSSTVKKDDVRAALSVLGMRTNAWEYWVRFPRESGLAVVSGSHKKQSSTNHAMPYDKVEAALSIRQSRRRPRSVSADSSTSAVSAGRSMEDAISNGRAEVNISVRSGPSSIQSPSLSDIEMSEDQESEMSGEWWNTPGRTASVTKAKKRRLLEDEQDQYLEELDQSARQQEESHLTQLLGLDTIEFVKQESRKQKPRPRVHRKAVEEAKFWSANYVAEWERFGSMVPEDQFAHRPEQ